MKCRGSQTRTSKKVYLRQEISPAAPPSSSSLLLRVILPPVLNFFFLLSPLFLFLLFVPPHSSSSYYFFFLLPFFFLLSPQATRDRKEISRGSVCPSVSRSPASPFFPCLSCQNPRLPSFSSIFLLLPHHLILLLFSTRIDFF